MSDPIWFRQPPPPSRVPQAPPVPAPERVELTIDGARLTAPRTATLLEVCRAQGIDIPTLCFMENLAPASACRLCLVEVAGSRTLVPACSRKVEAGMVVQTESARVQASRRMVLELLASSVDVSTSPRFQEYARRYGVDGARFGPGARVQRPVKVDNELYVRDLGKCILCYRCVAACGQDAQHSFAIAVAGRGFEAHISTEHDVALPQSACVFCGNCVGVCPTGALMFRSEHELRLAGEWDATRQTRTETTCSFCGVGCPLTLHVQDNQIVKVTSPSESFITRGHLCIKGRFGFEHVQRRPGEED